MGNYLCHGHQDTAKIEEVERETAESTLVIPKMEKEIVRLTQQLGEEEKALEILQEGCKGTFSCINAHRADFALVLISFVASLAEPKYVSS